MDNDLRERIRRTVLDRLESAAQAGLQQIGKMSSDLPRGLTQESTESPREPVTGAKTDGGGEPSWVGNRDDQGGETMATAATLEILQSEVATCTRCEELAKARNHTVFGVGNPDARLCFLGEAPGADEDRQGEPFVGRAGKLLTDIIAKGMKLERSDVYILNVLKCRPPANRNPTPEEAANCRPFLLQQFDLIRPEFICCLGAVAAQNLLETTSPIGRLRGSVHSWRGVRVVCTYHPAYLLRNPSAKAKTWEDIRLLMGEMGISTEK